MINVVCESFERTIAGRRLEIARWRSPSARGAAIVMLHEGLGSVSLWRDVPQRIAERTGHDVVAYSRYGYGRSERFGEPRDVTYLHDEAMQMLPALLEELGIARPILFGHSDGASIAIIYAGSQPADVSALVLEAPHVFVEDRSIESIAHVKNVFATTDLRAKLARHHDDPDATFRGWSDVWLDPRFRSWNIEAVARRITAPMLLVQGRSDEYGTLAQLTALAATPRARLVLLANCGHSPHRDSARETLDEVADFVSTVDARRSELRI